MLRIFTSEKFNPQTWVPEASILTTRPPKPSCIYFNSLHVSSKPVLIIRRNNCINTTSGICHSLSVTVLCAGRKETAHETVTDRE